MSVLSTQDSNNQKKKDSLTSSQANRSITSTKNDDKYKRNHTENTRPEDPRQKQQPQIRRDPSYKKRESSKENFYQAKDLRTSQSKEKSSWIRPSHKPGMGDSRGVGEKEIRYIEKGQFGTGYYRRK